MHIFYTVLRDIKIQLLFDKLHGECSQNLVIYD